MLSYADLTQVVEKHHIPTLSLYLLVDPAQPLNQSNTPAWRIWLTSTLKELEQRVPVNQADVWEAIRANVETFLSSYAPTGKTLVLFWQQDDHQQYELPIALKNYANFGEPALSLFVQAIDMCKPFLLSFVTHTSASFYVMTCAGVQHHATMELEIPYEQWREMPLMPATAAGAFVRAGSHRDKFNTRVDEQVERFFQRVADETIILSELSTAAEIVLSGNEAAAHAVHKYLPDSAVIGPLVLANHSSSSEVLQLVVPTVTEHRLEQDVKLVQDIIQLAKSGGRAVRGMDVIKALEQKAVELLLLPAKSANEPLVDKLVLDGILAGAQIKLVNDTAADNLIQECGIAARLYYRANL